MLFTLASVVFEMMSQTPGRQWGDRLWQGKVKLCLQNNSVRAGVVRWSQEQVPEQCQGIFFLQDARNSSVRDPRQPHLTPDLALLSAGVVPIISRGPFQAKLYGGFVVLLMK